MSQPGFRIDGMTDVHRRLATIAKGQLGVVSRRDAHAVGITDSQLRSRVSSGILDQYGPNSFRLAGVAPDAFADLRALVTDLAGEVFVSGRSAAALHGFDGYRLGPPFDVTIVRGRHLQRVGHRIHTTTELDLIDRCHVRGFRALSAARTLIDLARTETIEQLTIALDSGLRDGRFNESLVHRRIVALRSKGRYGIPKLLQAIDGREIIRGGHSWLEREFLRIVAAARLPAPLTQQVLTRAGDRVVRVDFRFPGTPVVVEVLGYRYHRSSEQMRRDAERSNALLADGFHPYQFTYEQVVAGADAMIQVLVAALAAAGTRDPRARSGSVSGIR